MNNPAHLLQIRKLLGRTTTGKRIRPSLSRLGFAFALILYVTHGLAAEHFFTPSESPFITSPKEETCILTQ